MFNIINNDVLSALRDMPNNTFDGAFCDPPYELGFMGKSWDSTGIAFQHETWAEVLRVCKPGAHLLAFGGSRTFHRLVCAVEDAGWEVRDVLMWLYGCLDTETKAVTRNGIKGYDEISVGEDVLCYCVESGSYSFQPALEVVKYDYCDTAYRVVGDFGEQVVSRNHRCIVEREGREVFLLAEEAAQECEARVPILENLQGLLEAIHDNDKRAGCSEQDVFQGLCKESDNWKSSKAPIEAQCESKNNVLCMREDFLQEQKTCGKSEKSCLFSPVQRSNSRQGMEISRSQGEIKLEERVRSGSKETNDRGNEPLLEGRPDIQKQKGDVCHSDNKICAMPGTYEVYVKEGRICDGTQTCGCNSDCTTVVENGGCSSHKSRCNRQSCGESNAVQDEWGTQSIRERGGHRSALVRIEPFKYTGIVWCLKVPTGAFVAMRNGVAFPTGNSGFPKSLDVSKAIDKAAGAEREVLATEIHFNEASGIVSAGRNERKLIERNITAAATESARLWDGYGTALKPAYEPIVLARKPLDGTVAQNVQKWGCGALWIDGGRIGTEDKLGGGHSSKGQQMTGGWERPWMSDPAAVAANAERSKMAVAKAEELGRWPANALHDGLQEEWARYFYCAKASQKERNAGCEGRNIHPTVKPLDLCRYLATLILPPADRPHGPRKLLVPFSGSGSEMIGSLLAGWEEVTGIEREVEYVAIARARLVHHVCGKTVKSATVLPLLAMCEEEVA